MIDPLAEQILSAMSGRSKASEIVLGGYFALQHYVDYRTTHDIDAWWKTRADPETERVIRDAMTRIAREQGLELYERRFGETLSFELGRAGQRHFSFQIAVRSVSLDEPQLSQWPPIRIETLDDNIGSKMNALVDRGSPRDFTDIRRVVEAGLMNERHCWELWLRKNPGAALDEARQKVLLHLSALEARRPLSSIDDAAARDAAAATRLWFKQCFLAAGG